MTTRMFLLSLMVMVALPLNAVLFAQNPNIGTAGAQFLQIPVGAGPTAMGGASTAHVKDATALFWNPAGIVNVERNAVHFSYTSWWASIQLNHAAFVHNADELGTFGVSATVLTMDKMEVTTELSPEGTGQFFDAQDLMIAASYARRLSDDFAVGLTAKYVNQRIWNESAVGFAFDVGTQYKIGFRDLTLAMSLTNFGGDMKYDGDDLIVRFDPNTQVSYNRLAPSRLAADDYPLPLHFQAGISMTVFSNEEFSALAAVDVTHPNDNKERVNIGAEIQAYDRLYLRGGYRFGYDTESATFGVGMALPLGDTKVSVDYAYALYDLLPNINRISLGLTF